MWELGSTPFLATLEYTKATSHRLRRALGSIDVSARSDRFTCEASLQTLSGLYS